MSSQCFGLSVSCQIVEMGGQSAAKYGGNPCVASSHTCGSTSTRYVNGTSVVGRAPHMRGTRVASAKPYLAAFYKLSEAEAREKLAAARRRAGAGESQRGGVPGLQREP